MWFLEIRNHCILQAVAISLSLGYFLPKHFNYSTMNLLRTSWAEECSFVELLTPRQHVYQIDPSNSHTIKCFFYCTSVLCISQHQRPIDLRKEAASIVEIFEGSNERGNWWWEQYVSSVVKTIVYRTLQVLHVLREMATWSIGSRIWLHF